MNCLMPIIFYMLACSVLFIYGIGLERLYFHSLSERPVLHFYIKNFVFVLIVSSFLWFFTKFVLFPLKMYFLLPLFLIAIIITGENLISILYKKIFPAAKYTVENEKVFTYGTILFGIYNSSGYSELLFTVFISFLTLFLFTIILKSIRIKIIDRNPHVYTNIMPMTLISLGVIGFTLYLIDVSWILSLFL